MLFLTEDNSRLYYSNSSGVKSLIGSNLDNLLVTSGTGYSISLLSATGTINCNGLYNHTISSSEACIRVGGTTGQATYASDAITLKSDSDETVINGNGINRGTTAYTGPGFKLMLNGGFRSYSGGRSENVFRVSTNQFTTMIGVVSIYSESYPVLITLPPVGASADTRVIIEHGAGTMVLEDENGSGVWDICQLWSSSEAEDVLATLYLM